MEREGISSPAVAVSFALRPGHGAFKYRRTKLLAFALTLRPQSALAELELTALFDCKLGAGEQGINHDRNNPGTGQGFPAYRLVSFFFGKGLASLAA